MAKSMSLIPVISGRPAPPLLYKGFLQDFGTWLQRFCSHRTKRAVMKSGSQSVFQFLLKVMDGFDVRALYRPLKFFHTKLRKPFLYELLRARGLCHAETLKGLLQTITKLEEYCLKYDFPSFEFRGPNYEKLPETKSNKVCGYTFGHMVYFYMSRVFNALHLPIFTLCVVQYSIGTHIYFILKTSHYSSSQRL